MPIALPSRVRRRAKSAVPVEQVVAELEPTALAPSATAVHRNLLTGTGGTWAYFLLEPVRWAFLSGLPEPEPSGERGQLLRQMALRTADLAGYRIHLRATAHPQPYNVWATQLHERSPHRIEDVEGAETWADYLRAGQNRIAELRAETPATYLGVRLTDKQLTHEQLQGLSSGVAAPDELTEVRNALRKVTGSVRKAGFGARPTSQRGLAWLMHSSIGLGLPVEPNAMPSPEGGWGSEEMRAFTSATYPAATPYSETVRIRGQRNGRRFERHVAVLTVDTFSPRQALSPSLWPWASHSQALPFHTEWSMTLDVNRGSDMQRSTEIVRQRAEAISEHYQEHGRRPPAAVGRAIEDAYRIEDEVQPDSGHPEEVAVRLVGPIRLAVLGETEAQALEHATAAIDNYREKQGVTLTHEYGQFAMYREFWPGENVALSAFTHVFNAQFFASSLPHASIALGDHSGPYLGFTGRHVVNFDPNWGPANKLSGLIVITGKNGRGKSTLGGIVMESHVRRGRQGLVYDGSGALARMCHAPHLRKNAREFELTGAKQGTLIPYRLIPEPLLHHFDKGEAAWRRAMLEADAERRDLMIDTIEGLLPKRLLDADPRTTGIIEDAVNAVGGAYDTDPWAVVAEFRRDWAGEIGQAIANRLEAAASMTGGALIFPERGDVDPSAKVDFGAALTVVTMRNLAVPPPGKPPVNRAERMAQPILHLASRHAAKAMYANQEPKFILVSEGSLVTGGESSFRQFTERASVDTRKQNTGFAIDTQNPQHIRQLSPEISNLIGAAFAGGTGSLEAAEATLPFLLAPTGHGYEQTLMDLEPGQFIGRFYDGAVGPFQVDRDYRPVLVDMLENSPAGGGMTEAHNAWAVEA